MIREGLLILASLMLMTCSQSCKKNQMVKNELYGIHKGKEVYLLTLTNKFGNVLKLTNFGARITWIEVPDKSGKKDNVTFGYDTFNGTVTGDMSFGSTIGRFANRIANGRFILDGHEYKLTLNNKPNFIHGGPGGWHSSVWNTEIIEKSEFPSVKFTLKSPDMEEGFPGNMEVDVIYTWTDDNEIIISYKAVSDKKTVFNITNHTYFNLHGAGNGDILDHYLTINASAFLPVDSVMIPTGELRSVSGTPFDFTSPHKIGDRIGENYDQLILGKGYDHNFVLDNNDEVDVIAYEPGSGRMLKVITDQPGIQLYTGNFLNGSRIGHGGKPYNFRSGFCLESGHFPDSPNQPAFPTTVLEAGETFKSITIYRFSVKQNQEIN